MCTSRKACLPEYVTVKTVGAICIDEQHVVYTICAAICIFLDFNNTRAVSVDSDWLCSPSVEAL